jgi:DNA-binding MarR family transcriptional regulator
MTAVPARTRKSADSPYILDDQVGFILRQVSQRHASIFADLIGVDLTPTQWATLAKLAERGTCSQNLLGRQTAMDAATIKGVVGRLAKRGLVETRADAKDARRIMVALTEEGRRTVERVLPDAAAITEATLSPLADTEREMLLQLLSKLR